MTIPNEVKAAGSGAVAVFRQIMSKYGDAGYRFALMCALRKAPLANTDREFTEGDNHGRWLDQMGPIRRKRLLAAAKKLGIDPAARIYKSGLGKPEDPRAWIESKADILRVAREKKLVIESDDERLNYEPEIAPRKEIALNPKIVDRLVKEKLAADKGLRAKVKKKPQLLKELRAAMTEKHCHPSKRKLVKG